MPVDIPKDLPAFLKPKLRLFLSVDIVGSTAYKQERAARLQDTQSHASGVSDWFTTSVKFYREMEHQFIAKWEQTRSSCKETYKCDAGPNPELWKGAGDELLYTKVLTDHRQALACVETWMKTAKSVRSEIIKDSSKLDLKCTAWLAGFPVQNCELVLRLPSTDSTPQQSGDSVFENLCLLEAYDRDRKNLYLDFVGPAIDTGFRLATFSNPRKFVISIELALMLAHSIETGNLSGDRKGIFGFDGKHALKGVLGDIPYPIFWIDMHHGIGESLESLEDEMLGKAPASHRNVESYARKFLDNVGDGRVFRPYIVGNQDSFFTESPGNHSQRLLLYANYWAEENRQSKSKLAASKPVKKTAKKPVMPREAEQMLNTLPKRGSSKAQKGTARKKLKSKNGKKG